MCAPAPPGPRGIIKYRLHTRLSGLVIRHPLRPALTCEPPPYLPNHTHITHTAPRARPFPCGAARIARPAHYPPLSAYQKENKLRARVLRQSTAARLRCL